MTILVPDDAALTSCAETLRAGGVVAVPTETVYGLAADAASASAVNAVYALKSRPSSKPLIRHVTDLDHALSLGIFDAEAYRLAERFWPGPLTLIVPRRCPDASGGQRAVALRCPAHPVLRDLIARVGRALVVPSANPSGRMSPTEAAHVAHAFPDIDVLDGGACTVGVESTIVRCMGGRPTRLRPGVIASEILAALGVDVASVVTVTDAPPASESSARREKPDVLRIDRRNHENGEVLLGFGPHAPPSAFANLSPTGDPDEAAANLFSMLRRLYDLAAETGRAPAVMPIPADTGPGEAINDRLRRIAKGPAAAAMCGRL